MIAKMPRGGGGEGSSSSSRELYKKDPSHDFGLLRALKGVVVVVSKSAFRSFIAAKR